MSSGMRVVVAWTGSECERCSVRGEGIRRWQGVHCRGYGCRYSGMEGCRYSRRYSCGVGSEWCSSECVVVPSDHLTASSGYDGCWKSCDCRWCRDQRSGDQRGGMEYSGRRHSCHQNDALETERKYKRRGKENLLPGIFVETRAE